MLPAVLRGKWALRAAAALQARLREKVGLSVVSAGSATIPSQLMIMATASRGMESDTRRLPGVIYESPLAGGLTVCLPSRAVLPPIAQLFSGVTCRPSTHRPAFFRRCVPFFRPSPGLSSFSFDVLKSMRKLLQIPRVCRVSPGVCRVSPRVCRPSHLVS